MRTMIFTVVMAGATAVAPATAQQSSASPAAAPSLAPATQATQGIKRTILQRHDVPGTNLETIVALVEVAANFKAGRHTHPGNVTGVVTEGEFWLTIDGQPEKVMKAGDSILVPPGATHDEGTKAAPAKLVAVYVVEKGKPLAAPVK